MQICEIKRAIRIVYKTNFHVLFCIDLELITVYEKKNVQILTLVMHSV